MTKYSQILFSTHSPYLKAYISSSNSFEKPLAILTREKFGMKIHEASIFKN
jgi:hypothetical protein